MIIQFGLNKVQLVQVPLKNNKFEYSEGVLHQPILSVWSRLNVYCSTTQRILNYAALLENKDGFCVCETDTCAISTAGFFKQLYEFWNVWSLIRWRMLKIKAAILNVL